MNPSGGSSPFLELVYFSLQCQRLWTLPSQAPHFSPRDKVKIFLSLWIKKCHCFHRGVICSNPERDIIEICNAPWPSVRVLRHKLLHLKGMISSCGKPGAIPSTFPPWVGSYKSPPTLLSVSHTHQDSNSSGITSLSGCGIPAGSLPTM